MSDNENDNQSLQLNEDDSIDNILSNTNSKTVTKPKDKRRKRGSSHLSRKVKGGTKKTCTTSKRITKTSKAEPPLATNAQSGATVKPKSLLPKHHQFWIQRKVDPKHHVQPNHHQLKVHRKFQPRVSVPKKAQMILQLSLNN